MSGVISKKYWRNYKFYIYIYRELEETPIYVGKGSFKKVHHGTARWRRHYQEKTRLGNRLRKLREKFGYSLIPEIIEIQDELTAFKKEIELISIFGRCNLGTGSLYNLTGGGEGSPGRVISEEFRKKIKDSSTGRKHKPETIELLREISKNYRHTEEAKIKIGNGNRGKEVKQETRDKISKHMKVRMNENNPFLGKKLSQETKNKISAKSSGRILSEETKRKMSLAQKAKALEYGTLEEYRLRMSSLSKGRKASPETIAKMSASIKGRTLSAETKKKISDTKKRKKLEGNI